VIYDDLKLDMLMVPSAYEMDAHLENKTLNSLTGWKKPLNPNDIIGA